MYDNRRPIVYVPLPFLRLPPLGIWAEEPLHHRTVAVVDLKGRSSGESLPNADQWRMMVAYLCGDRKEGIVFDLNGYDPATAAVRAAMVAVNMKSFHEVRTRFVGLAMDGLEVEEGSLTEVWKDHLTQQSYVTIDDAVRSLLPK